MFCWWRVLKKKAMLIVPAAAVLGFWYYGLGGAGILMPILPFEYADSFVRLFLLFGGLSVLYEVGSVVLKSLMPRLGAKEGEVTMLHGVLKFAVIFAGFIAGATYWFSLGAIGTIFAAFGGMFLGWSLQAPVSGFAAWFLISIIRPFSVGDRLQFPSYGLVGDVISISPLYTILNQVGGSVGSEEPANRTILIPNAMLFSSLAINYTPKNQEKLIEQFRDKFNNHKGSSESAYMLDEYVLRMSFDSDWDEAERILLKVARDVTADIIKETGQEPYIRADASDWYGVFMRLRFMTLATERPKIMYEFTKRIHKEVQSSDKVDIAIPYVYSFKKGLQSTPSFPIEPFSMEKPLKFIKEPADNGILTVEGSCPLEFADSHKEDSKIKKSIEIPA